MHLKSRIYVIRVSIGVKGNVNFVPGHQLLCRNVGTTVPMCLSAYDVGYLHTQHKFVFKIKRPHQF